MRMLGSRGLIRSSVLLVVAVVGLAGCGDGSGKDDAAATTFAKVPTKFGEISIPAEPKRVVALGWGDAETALALGVQPVGASDWLAFGGEGVGPWATGRYTTPPQKIGTLEPEYEKIAALKPDLILDTKSSGDQGRYDTLKAIAPTVGVPAGGDAYKVSQEKLDLLDADLTVMAPIGIDATKITSDPLFQAVPSSPPPSASRRCRPA
jgi:iron complex transport system substrate-binding protein